MIGRIVIITLSVGHIFLCISAIPISRNNTGIEPYAGGSPLFYGTRTTLTDLGVMTMKMLETLSNSEKEDTINIEGLKDLVSVLSEGALMMDNPQDKFQLISHNKQFKKLEQDIVSLKNENVQLQKEIERNKADILQKLDEHNVSVTPARVAACSVYLKGTQTYKSGDVIKFTGIIYNDGSYYNTESGLFICSSEGFYLVSAYLEPSDQIRVNILVNKSLVGTLYTGKACQYDGDESYVYQYDGHCDRSMSATVVVKCEAGESISLVAYEDGKIVGSQAENQNGLSQMWIPQYPLDKKDKATDIRSMLSIYLLQEGM